MLDGFPVAVVVGTILGFLAGLGIGGGSLLMLWLTMVLNMPYEDARGINLLFFLPCAFIACFFRWKQGAVSWKTVLPAILSGCISAAVVSILCRNLELHIIRKLFGGLLLITGLHEVRYKTN